MSVKSSRAEVRIRSKLFSSCPTTCSHFIASLSAPARQTRRRKIQMIRLWRTELNLWAVGGAGPQKWVVFGVVVLVVVVLAAGHCAL